MGPGLTEPQQRADLGRLFDEARTHNRFDDQPVPEVLLRQLYDHLKWAPTAANSSPARFVFVTSAEAKARLVGCVNEGNRDKVASAPVTVIVAADTRFYDEMPTLFPSRDFRAVFAGRDVENADLLARNVALQGGYMIVAARGLGLDCGPMSGFDADAVNAQFMPDGRWRANFICTLGYGLREHVHPRNPRLPFESACRIV